MSLKYTLLIILIVYLSSCTGDIIARKKRRSKHIDVHNHARNHAHNHKHKTDSETNGFGAHIMIKGDKSIGRIRGVQCEFCGQLNVLGRYPFHVHRYGDCSKRVLMQPAILSMIQSQLLSIDPLFWIMIDYEDFVSRPLQYVDIISDWLLIKDKELIHTYAQQTINST